MAFWDFLKDANTEKRVVGKAFNFLSRANPAVAQYRDTQAKLQGKISETKQSPGLSRVPGAREKLAQLEQDVSTPDPAERARDFGVGVARGVARIPETLVRSGAQIGVDLGAMITGGERMDLSSGKTADPVRKFFYGDEPVETYQKRRAGYEKTLGESRFRTFDTPLSYLGLGLAVAGDVTGGGKKEAGEQILSRLAKETTEEGVKKALKGKVIPEVADRVSGAIARTKDTNIIRNIIANADAQIPPPRIISRLPAESDELVDQVRRGKLQPNVDTAPISALKLGTDVLDKYDEKRIVEYMDIIRRGETIDPIIINANGLVQDGKHRLAAMRRLNVKEVPVVEQISPPIPEAGPTKQRKFVQTVKESDTEQPLAKQAAESIAPQTYKQKQNKDLLKRAQEIVDEDYDGAVTRIKSSTADVNRLDEDVAVGQVLVQKALKEGRVDEASDLIDAIDRRGRATGRGSQALAIWGRLTPEGILKIANQKIRKAREAIKGGAKVTEEGGVASKLKGEVENAVKIDKGDVEKTLKQIARDVDAEEKTVAEQVAKHVEKAMTPQKKKKIDTLVEELTKKIKQEQLAPLPKARKKSPTDILKEVFGRTKEAEEAYPEVKAILKERFADDVGVLKQLDQFFGSELGLPPASSTINSAIKEQLLKEGAKVREIIYKSWDNQKRSVDDIAKALTKEGFDEKSAKSLADEVVTRLNKQLGEAKSTVLNRMLEDVPKQARDTFIQKIEKLSNLGALDNADYINLARAKLKLPELTPEITKDVSAMAQRLQGLEDGPEKNKLISDIMSRINDAIPVTKGEKFEAYRYQNILSGPRSQARNTVSNLFNTMITRPATMAVKAGTDWFSAATKGTERTASLKDVPIYYKNMFNSTGDAVEAMKGAWRGHVNIENPDLANLRAYRLNKLPKKYTVITRAMEAQDRFFQTLISSGEYAVQKSKGVADDIARAEAEKVAKYSLFRAPTDAKNISGQGALLSKIDQFTDAMQSTTSKVPALRWFVPFIATPMNITKQFIEFSPAGFSTLYKAGGDKKAEQAAKALIGTTITALGAKMALDGNTTWAVPKNEKEKEAFYAAGKKPYSIKIGDRWVPMISFGPFAYALALPASIKDSNDRAPLDASQLDKLTGVLTGQAKFFSGQTYVQGVSDFVDVISGSSDKTAQSALAGIASQVVPLEGLKKWVTTVVDPVYRKRSTFADEFRASTPFASKKLEAYTEPDTGEPSRRNITDYVLPYSQGVAKGTTSQKQQKQAVSEFYRIQSRSSQARSKANEDINKAIKAGDSALARKIAAEYNQKYADSFKGWAKKYGEDATNAELLKEYKGRKINLTSSRVKARRRTVKNNLRKRSIYSATRGEV